MNTGPRTTAPLAPIHKAPDLQALHEKAAAIILRHANELRRSCQGNSRDWACDDCTGDCAARRDHAEMVETVVRLRGVN